MDSPRKERKHLIDVIQCVRFLARQGIAIQANPGDDNFTQLFKLLGTKDPSTHSTLKKINKIKVYPQWYSKWTAGFNGSAGSSWKVERNSRKRLFCDNARRIPIHQEPWTIINVFQNFFWRFRNLRGFHWFLRIKRYQDWLNSACHQKWPVSVKSFSLKQSGSNLWRC